jgi:SAM-dependent methyltransferase
MYDAYAPIYDAIGQGQLSVRMARWALRWLPEQGLQSARVLDLACGTGEAALVFAAAGCRVAGLDRSAAMLEIARGKARDAGYDVEFAQSDIRELEPRTKNQEPLIPAVGSRLSVLGSQFNLVTCLYDSLNYLLDDRDLDRVFAGAARVLRPGGYIVFDLNTAAEYATWDERDSVTYDGRDCLVYNQLSYDPATRLAEGRIVWFVRELDRWWRGEETHVERAWDDAEVLGALERARLALAGRYDATGEIAGETTPRVVYVAQKV